MNDDHPTLDELDWARSIGSRIAGVTVPHLREDAEQEACVAALEAGRTFQTPRGVPFRAWCRPWITNRVRAMLRKWRGRASEPGMSGARFRRYHNARPSERRGTLDDSATRAVDARDVVEAVGRRFGRTCEAAVRACDGKRGASRQWLAQRRSAVRPLLAAILAPGGGRLV